MRPSLDGRRNNLGLLVRNSQPKTIMMENVPGLAGDRRLSYFVKKSRSLGILMCVKY